MPDNQSVKILVVDDLPEQSLIYQSLLDEPGQEVVSVQSGRDALKHLLKDDFAVILLDVNMPDMDGFETASVIRSRKRCAHTPIIFITAYVGELHALRGYSYGAVDYILAPVTPAVLKTKVRVFVELFRLNRQLHEQTAKPIAMAETEGARLKAALDTAMDFVAHVDANGRVLDMNRAGQRMLGYHNDQNVALMQCYAANEHEALKKALATAAREGVWFGEALLQTRDGRYIPVSGVILANKDQDQQVSSFSVIARDISDQKRVERAISESERRYRQLVQALPAAAYTCDAQGRILMFNEAAVLLWGRQPEVGQDQWCGSWRIYRPDGSPLPLDECPMAVTLKECRPVRGQEILIERADGTRRNVMPYPEPIVDSSGTLVGALNMLVDITESKRADETRALLASIVDSTDDVVISKTLNGVITSCNRAAARLFGYTTDELIGQPITRLIPPNRIDEEGVILDRVRQGEHIEHYETVRIAKDGRQIEVSLSISPMRDVNGRIVGASKIGRDISERKRTEAELASHRTRLEELVRERTSELEDSLERLRQTDRLASIGTLAAGLGHDMGNLLLPIRMRLDSLERMGLPDAAQKDLEAIKTAAEYLRRLSQGLRQFSQDSDDMQTAREHTALSRWWPDTEPFVRNALPRTIRLDVSIPADLPAIAIAPHKLTQMIYNLLRNAADAMSGRASGQVQIVVESIDDGQRAAISVIDNGPGMADEVKRHCMEPFFTTKTRSISTGLGLALVRSAALKAGGSIEINSRPGHGTTVRLILPVARRDQESTLSSETQRPQTAYVELNDTRLKAYVVSILQTLNVCVRKGKWYQDENADLVILDAAGEFIPALGTFLGANLHRRAVIIGDVPPTRELHQAMYLESRPAPSEIRRTLQLAVAKQDRSPSIASNGDSSIGDDSRGIDEPEGPSLHE